jgi:glutamate racemase
LVEAAVTVGPAAERALRPILEPLLDCDVDVVVLGCTHFPFLRAEIERLVGPGVRVVDSGEAIARRTRSVLAERGLCRESGDGSGRLSVLTSGDADRVGALSRRLLGLEVEPAAVAL